MNRNVEEDAILRAEKVFKEDAHFIWRKVEFLLTTDDVLYRREVYRSKVALGMAGKIVNTGWVRRGQRRRSIAFLIRFLEESGFTWSKGPRFTEPVTIDEKEDTA